MIISRLIARARIAKREHPSFWGAYALVLADALVIAILLALIWTPLMTRLDGAPLGLTIAVLFGVIYIPFQWVVIVSTIWAVKSRWQDEDTT